MNSVCMIRKEISRCTLTDRQDEAWNVILSFMKKKINNKYKKKVMESGECDAEEQSAGEKKASSALWRGERL